MCPLPFHAKRAAGYAQVIAPANVDVPVADPAAAGFVAVSAKIADVSNEISNFDVDVNEPIFQPMAMVLCAAEVC